MPEVPSQLASDLAASLTPEAQQTIMDLASQVKDAAQSRLGTDLTDGQEAQIVSQLQAGVPASQVESQVVQSASTPPAETTSASVDTPSTATPPTGDSAPPTGAPPAVGAPPPTSPPTPAPGSTGGAGGALAAGAAAVGGAAMGAGALQPSAPDAGPHNLPSDLKARAAAAGANVTPPGGDATSKPDDKGPPPPSGVKWTPKTVDPDAIKRNPYIQTPSTFQDGLNALKDEGKKLGYLSESGEDAGAANKFDEADKQAIIDWDAKRAQLDKAYSDTKDRLAWGEAAETFGKALSRLGAGLYGLKTGLNVSGGNFDVSDWSKRYDQAFKDYQADLQGAKEKSDLVTKQIEQSRREYQDWRQRYVQSQQIAGNAELQARSESARLAEFNVTQQNQWALEQARDAAEWARLSFRGSPEQEAIAKAKADAYVRDVSSYQQSQREGASVLSALSDPKMTSKEKDALVAKELPKLGAMYPPGVVDAAVAKVNANSDFWQGRDTYYNQLQAELSKHPLRSAPKISDYFGQSAATPAAASTTQTTSAMVRFKKPDGSLVDIPSANAAKAEQAGYVRVTQ